MRQRGRTTGRPSVPAPSPLQGEGWGEGGAVRRMNPRHEDRGQAPPPAGPGSEPVPSRLHGEAGQIALEYVLLLAAVILPLVGVVYMLWKVLMYFYWNNALVLSIPYL